MQEKIIWFVCGYIFCIIVTFINEFEFKKKVKE